MGQNRAKFMIGNIASSLTPSREVYAIFQYSYTHNSRPRPNWQTTPIL